MYCQFLSCYNYFSAIVVLETNNYKQQASYITIIKMNTWIADFWFTYIKKVYNINVYLYTLTYKFIFHAVRLMNDFIFNNTWF